jgi:lipopolysaccharide/colanic/teichoic acid biosynthesis glycosyltransferase
VNALLEAPAAPSAKTELPRALVFCPRPSTTESVPVNAADGALVEYWSKAGTRGGRAGIMARLWWKRLAWRVVTRGSRWLKRILDVLVATVTTIVLLPLLLMIAVLIKLEGSGSILFSQTRVGLRGRSFRMWKFRSMASNAEALKASLSNEMPGGVLFKMKRDPRITRVGRWLRRFSLDELPQLFNVLRGDMALVGPRPPLPTEVERYKIEDRQRLLAKPGLTCFWQVGGRSEIGFDDQVRLDLDYIRSASLALNFILLLRTIPAVLLGKGAY